MATHDRAQVVAGREVHGHDFEPFALQPRQWMAPCDGQVLAERDQFGGGVVEHVGECEYRTGTIRIGRERRRLDDAAGITEVADVVIRAKAAVTVQISEVEVGVSGSFVSGEFFEDFALLARTCSSFDKTIFFRSL